MYTSQKKKGAKNLENNFIHNNIQENKIQTNKLIKEVETFTLKSGNLYKKYF